MSEALQSITDDSISISSLSDLPQDSRLSIPFKYRLPATTIGGSAVGLLLGVSHGARVTGLRFRAENAHRLPSSSTGWYLYHKSKNYHMALGGVKEGLKMGAKMSFWVGTFFTIEEAIDGFSGKRDFMSTTAAGLTVAGGFSAWNRFPLLTAARTAKIGLLCGLGFGLLQDALSLLKGKRLDYVDFFLGQNRRSRDTMN